MNEVYDYLPKDEIARVEKLEFLDERELVKQLFEHYCITFAWINGIKINKIRKNGCIAILNILVKLVKKESGTTSLNKPQYLWFETSNHGKIR